MSEKVYRADLEKPTDRIARLPVHRGYPVPWFVAWIDGEPEFRAMDPNKWAAAVNGNLCWVCGEPLGVFKAYVVGPMCCINRTSSEPPSHVECAEWSVRNCPFLSRPQMKRRDCSDIGEVGTLGKMIDHNPGVTAIYKIKGSPGSLFPDGKGCYLIQMPQPTSITIYREGRLAPLEDTMQAIETGLPILLQEAAREGPEAIKDLLERREWLNGFLQKE